MELWRQSELLPLREDALEADGSEAEQEEEIVAAGAAGQGQNEGGIGAGVGNGGLLGIVGNVGGQNGHVGAEE